MINNRISDTNAKKQIIFCYKPLPTHLRIPDADSHLYRIGLSLNQSQSHWRRSPLKHPIAVFLVLANILIRSLVLINWKNEESDQFYLYFGDFAKYLGIGKQLNFICAMDSLLAIGSQAINYFNYKNNVADNDLKVFGVLSGRLTPLDVGLTDPEVVAQLVRHCRLSFRFNNSIVNWLTLSAFFIVFFGFATKAPITGLVIVGLPHTILWALWINHLIGIMVWQTAYYYVITYFLNLKLKSVNQRLAKKLMDTNDKSNANTLSLNVMRQLNRTYSEIREYNRNYWSKYLGVFWMTYSSIIAAHIYIGFFSEMNVVLKITMNYYLVTYVSILIFVIRISSAITIESFSTYKLLYSLSFDPKIKTLTKNKVN